MVSLLSGKPEAQILAFAFGLLFLFILETIRPYYDYFHKSIKERGKHAMRNLLIGGFNAALVNLMFVVLWLSASLWAEENHFGLLNWLKSAPGMPLWLHTFGALVLLDAWMYVWHRINHAIPFLWRFHRLHHSDPMLDVTTASRFHVGEILISSAMRIPLILLIGVFLRELLFYETLMFAVIQFHHANIGLPPGIDRSLRTIIVSPDMHKVHHSRYRPETDSNFSSMLSIWDRLFGTFRINPKPETIRTGLEELDRKDDQTISGMLKTPFLSRRDDV